MNGRQRQKSERLIGGSMIGGSKAGTRHNAVKKAWETRKRLHHVTDSVTDHSNPTLSSPRANLYRRDPQTGASDFYARKPSRTQPKPTAGQVVKGYELHRQGVYGRTAYGPHHMRSEEFHPPGPATPNKVVKAKVLNTASKNVPRSKPSSQEIHASLMKGINPMKSKTTSPTLKKKIVKNAKKQKQTARSIKRKKIEALPDYF